MEDVSNSPAVAPRHAPHYMLEPEWPHRAVPVGSRAPRHAAAHGESPANQSRSDRAGQDAA